MFEQSKYSELYNYNSKLEDWYDRASVRTGARRYISGEELSEKVFFPPQLFPIASHPIIQSRGPTFVQKILVHRLYAYLDFTEHLEHQIVNQVAFQIARSQLGVELYCEMKFDAYKIYVDEAYHAMCCADLKNQVAEVTGITPITLEGPRFLQELRKIQESVSSELRDLVGVFFTIISETLISGTLLEVPKDEQVVDAVRTVVLDHAQDEKRHHAYFASLLGVLWPQLKPKHQSIIGPLLPKLIFSFLEPDLAAIGYYLQFSDLTDQEIDIVLEESYPRVEVITSTRNAAKATLKHFQQNSLFEDPYTAEAFERSGLTDTNYALIHGL